MTEIICPECQYKNEAEAKYCEECGILLKAEKCDDFNTSYQVYEPGEMILNRYEVISKHKSNSYDASYLAMDHAENSKKVWVKQKFLIEESEAEYLQQEKLFVLLKNSYHKHVGNLIDFSKEETSYFLVFEYLKGQDLQVILDRSGKAITQDLVLELAIQITEGLKFLHSQNILHRDIQPVHIFLTEDGIAKIIGFSRICLVSECPSDNAVTDGYSPPEAYGLVGGNLNQSSDIFSLGVTLYSLLLGKPPKFSRENFFSFVFKQEGGIKIDPSMEYIVSKSVKKEPKERYCNIEELLLSLKRLKENGFSQNKEPVKEISLDIASLSHVGKVRSINQDSSLVMDLKAFEKSFCRCCNLMVVADGMGGEAEGDKASSMAIRVVGKEILSRYLPLNIGGGDTTKLYLQGSVQERTADILKQSLLKANKKVYEYSREDPSRKGMGSTISAAIVEGNNLCVCHAGDTRAYIFNKRKGLVQLTEDHSLVGRLVRMGQMTREEAHNSPQRSAVYRALGTTPELEVDVYQYYLNIGDYLLICSDGIWEYFPDRELISVILEEGNPRAILERLINLCLERGADDNATGIIALVKEAESSQKEEESKTMFLPKIEKVKPSVASKEEVFLKSVSDKRMREEMEKKQMKEEMEKDKEKLGRLKEQVKEIKEEIKSSDELTKVEEKETVKEVVSIEESVEPQEPESKNEKEEISKKEINKEEEAEKPVVKAKSVSHNKGRSSGKKKKRRKKKSR